MAAPAIPEVSREAECARDKCEKAVENCDELFTLINLLNPVGPPAMVVQANPPRSARKGVISSCWGKAIEGKQLPQNVQAYHLTLTLFDRVMRQAGCDQLSGEGSEVNELELYQLLASVRRKILNGHVIVEIGLIMNTIERMFDRVVQCHEQKNVRVKLATINHQVACLVGVALFRVDYELQGKYYF